MCLCSTCSCSCIQLRPDLMRVQHQGQAHIQSALLLQHPRNLGAHTPPHWHRWGFRVHTTRAPAHAALLIDNTFVGSCNIVWQQQQRPDKSGKSDRNHRVRGGGVAWGVHAQSCSQCSHSGCHGGAFWGGHAAVPCPQHPQLPTSPSAGCLPPLSAAPGFFL